MTNKTETSNVSLQELLANFNGKHVNIIPVDKYGISISMNRATLEIEDSESELYFVSRDTGNNVISSICISEDSIENIEQYGDTYTINFTHDMTSVDISECKTV